MNARFSRRVALAAGVSAAAGLIARSAPVPKGDDNTSWVGKTVLPKKPDPVAVYKDEPPVGTPFEPDEAGEVRKVLSGASWEVKSEKNMRVEVIEDGLSFWLEKEKLVPLADAIDYFTKALETDEKDAYAHNFRGWAKYLLGKSADAVKDFDKFLELAPAGRGHRVVGLSNRGLVLAEMGKFDAALKDLDDAVQQGHTPAQVNRGWAYELKGEYKKAVDDYTAVLTQHAASALPLNNLAWLKATCPDAKFRDGKEAVRLAREVCDRSGNREGMFLDTLAAAHAEAGDFAAAVKAQERALEDKGFVRKYGDDARKRLQLYTDKKPYRSAPLK